MNQSDEIIIFKSEKEMPPLAVSLGSMRWNRTGSWRYIRPKYENKTPPCDEACPAGEHVEGVQYLCHQGKFEDAWKLILEEHPFPAVQGRVCYHPCEDACNRGQFDEAISIHSVERFVGDYGLHHGLIPPGLPPEKGFKRSERIGVVGAGPAGLVCAYHLARMGYSTVVLEAHPVPGGILRVGIPPYRLPKEILEAEIEHIKRVGVDIQTNSRVDHDLLMKDLKKFNAIYIAPGAHASRSLNVPGENARGVMSGLQFLIDFNLGKKVELGRKVAVIGGGNTAMDAARSALRLGSEVVVVYRRSRAEMPAIPAEVEEAEHEGIPIHFLATPTRVMTDNERVTQMECVRMELGEPDESGRRRPVPVKGSEFIMDVDTILTAIGESADLSFLTDDIKTEWGSICIDDFGGTSVEGIFAGGDAVDQPRTVAHAIGSGKRAAIAIDAFLRGKKREKTLASVQIGQKGSLSMEQYLRCTIRFNASKIVRFEDINVAYFEQKNRVHLSRIQIEEAKKSFDEVNEGLTKESVLEEVDRCFNCGVCNMCENCWVFCPDVSISRKNDEFGYDIDYDHCKGCGICVEECPRAAMSMEEEIK